MISGRAVARDRAWAMAMISGRAVARDRAWAMARISDIAVARDRALEMARIRDRAVARDDQDQGCSIQLRIGSGQWLEPCNVKIIMMSC